MIKYKRFVGILFSLIYTIREISRQSSPFEVWGEMKNEEMSQYEIHFPNVSSPKVSSAPNCELLLKAIETMNRDVASVEQNRGGGVNKQNSFLGAIV